MTILEIKQYLENLTGHITFTYNSCLCGIDPLARNDFDMWYGDDIVKVNSIESVMENKLFGGKSLPEIIDDVEDFEY